MDVLVIGGGVSGLATAYTIEREAERRGVELSVQLVEADSRLGGKVDTRVQDGFVIEAGVNGWLDSKPSTGELCSSLGIGGELLVSNDAARKRFVLRCGALHALPESPGAFVRSRLLSWGGKARLLCEPWARASTDKDESVADFVRRRLGPEALEALLDPMVSGVFAGDPAQLSLKSAFPRIAEIEQKYGGLIRGLLAIQRERRTQRSPGQQAAKVGPAPAGRLTSFAPGTKRLIEATAAALKNPPIVGRRAVGATEIPGGFRVRFADQSPMDTKRLVVATPAWAATRIVDGIDTALGRELAGIPYAAVAVVAMAWRRQDVHHDLAGFGFLVPSGEGCKILGSLWDSSIFTSRAPNGYVLIRTMVGGMRHRELALAAEADIIASVRDNLRHIMGIIAAPYLAEVFQHERAIPQYPPGHAERLNRIAERQAQHPGLFVTGNAYRGIGINDCTAAAQKLAPRVLDNAS